jgi:uncharacterized CHY-type Zn-finger protein
MKNKIIFFLATLILILSCSSYAWIIEQLSCKDFSNYNKTGVVTKYEYLTKFNDDTKVIRAYSYRDNNTENNANNKVFVLIPRDPLYVPNYDDSSVINNPIERMNNYLNHANNYLSLTRKTQHNILYNIANINTENSPELIKQDIHILLTNFNYYLEKNKLDRIFNYNKLKNIANSIVGSYGFFMPENMSQIDSFNGTRQTLHSAVITLDQLLLTKDNFNLEQGDISDSQLMKLQSLIFLAAQTAKTSIFLPALIETTQLKKHRIPIAVIDNFKVNSDNQGNICDIIVELAIPKYSTNCHHIFCDFIKEKNLLMINKTNQSSWEYITLTLKISVNDNPKKYFDVTPSRFFSKENTIFSNLEVNTVLTTPAEQEVISNITEVHVPDYRKSNLLLADFLIDYDWQSEDINTMIFNAKLKDYEPSIVNNTNNTIINSLITYFKTTKSYPKCQPSDHCIQPICTHYKRNQCLVKFDCCDNFWGCHKCHNEFSNKIKYHAVNKYNQNFICVKNDNTSKHAQIIKCTKCDHAQNFNSEATNKCLNCNLKFAEYFCSICKHLTALDYNHPFHCDQCGICLRDSHKYSNKAFFCPSCKIFPSNLFDKQPKYMKYISSNCNHHNYKFLVKFSCCSNYWGCYICHDTFYKKTTQKYHATEINHLCIAVGKTTENYQKLKCIDCGNEQDFNSNNIQKCLKCGVDFGKCFCSECKKIMPIEAQPYHCDICKSCYKGISNHHCNKCNKCVTNKHLYCNNCNNCVRVNHTCRILNDKEECGICLENYNISEYKVLPCSHVIHLSCLIENNKAKITKCPMCRCNFSLDY